MGLQVLSALLHHVDMNTSLDELEALSSILRIKNRLLDITVRNLQPKRAKMAKDGILLTDTCKLEWCSAHFQRGNKWQHAQSLKV